MAEAKELFTDWKTKMNAILTTLEQTIGYAVGFFSSLKNETRSVKKTSASYDGDSWYVHCVITTNSFYAVMPFSQHTGKS